MTQPPAYLVAVLMDGGATRQEAERLARQHLQQINKETTR